MHKTIIRNIWVTNPKFIIILTKVISIFRWIHICHQFLIIIELYFSYISFFHIYYIIPDFSNYRKKTRTLHWKWSTYTWIHLIIIIINKKPPVWIIIFIICFPLVKDNWIRRLYYLWVFHKKWDSKVSCTNV